MSRTEFTDLALSGHLKQVLACGVCIVGAGAAGIYLASRLVSGGVDVVLMEGGGVRPGEGATVGFDSDFDLEPYEGATKGRFFGIGGTTGAWGGALLPYSNYDVMRHDNHDAWCHIVDTVNTCTPSVLASLNYHHEGAFASIADDRIGLDSSTLTSAGIGTMSALWLPFRFKNLTFLLKRAFARTGRLRVFYNAVVKGDETEVFASVGGCRIGKLSAISRNGNELCVGASHFVFAAGAIESARLLLEMNSQGSQPVTSCPYSIGKYLSDHLSLAVADVSQSSTRRSLQRYAPFFRNGWMRNTRFVELCPPCESPRGFAHFVIDGRDTGFALARTVLSALQKRSMPRIAFNQLISGSGGLINLIMSRYLRSELYLSQDTLMNLQLDIEQCSSAANRITLGSRLDDFGRRIPVVSWQIQDIDWVNMRTTAERILSKWPSSMTGVPSLVPRKIASSLSKPHDTYHPTGICRMGTDSDAVTSFNLQVRGTDNLWLLSTGIFPSAGTANPTFSLLCFAEKLSASLRAVGFAH